MSLKLGCLVLLAAAAVSSCAGSKPPAETAQSEPVAQESTDQGSGAKAEEAGDASRAGSAAGGVPNECYKGKDPCLPDPKFVKKLCNNRYPAIALYLFANPKFARGYLTRKTEAWNASGGASAGGFVEFDEEVLLLFERKADQGGMQVSGAGASYDALRWDGSCVTLSGEEVTREKPPSPKTPKIEWRFLDDNVQEALRTNGPIDAAYKERRSECKGAVSGDVSAKCVKADARLGEAIVAYVRSGATLPTPSTLPE